MTTAYAEITPMPRPLDGPTETATPTPARPATARPATVLTCADLARPLPPLDYLVRDLALVAGGGAPHMVAGYGFSGKTLSLQQMLLALAARRQVWDAYSCTRRRVIHVDCEQGERLTARRYQRLAAAMEVDLAALGDALVVAAMPPITLVPEHRDRWRELMMGRDVIVIDSLRAATPGTDENASDVRQALDMLGSISAETDCRAIVIHHARKPPVGEKASSNRYVIRGSSSLYDGCDAVLVFSAEPDEPISVAVVKARSHGELPDDLALVIEDVPIGDTPKGGVRVSMRGSELVQEHRDKVAADKRERRATQDAETIRQALAKHPRGLGSEELRGLVSMSGQRFGAAKAKLLEMGHLAIERDGRRVIHRLTGGGS